MKIINKKKKANYLNFRVNGESTKLLIPANLTVNLPLIVNINQIINLGDFKRGFFEIIEEIKEIEIEIEDSLEKAKKEVKNYTDNKE